MPRTRSKITADGGIALPAITSSDVLATDASGNVTNGVIGGSQGGHYGPQSIGNGVATSFTITHNLGVEDVVVTLINASTNQVEGCLVTVIDTNSLTLSAAAWTTTPPATNSYRVTVDTQAHLSIATSAASYPKTYTLEADYSAPASGSVQTALQNAVNDILLNKGGGRILLKDRVYDFDSIVWPTVGLDKPCATIEFVGPYMPDTVGYMPGTGLTLAQGGDMPPPSKGAILKSTQVSGSGFGGISAWSNILPVFRNVIVRTPANPQWHGIDCGWCTNLVCEGVVIDTGRSWGDGSNPLSAGPIIQPTNTGVIAIIFPGEGNGGISVGRDLLTSGYYYGLRHSEHFDGDRITLAKNINGLCPVDGWHAARIGRLSLYWNKYGITPVKFNATHPTTRLNIQQLDTEEDPVGGNWYTTTYHINDPNNYLRGMGNYHRMKPNLGPTFSLLRRGGAYMNMTHINVAPGVLIDAVGYEGANSTTVLPPSAAGQVATQLRGTWGVHSQRAYLATVSGTTAGDLAVWDCGSTQVTINTRLVATTTGLLNTGVACLAVGNADYVFAVLTGSGCSIQKVDTGAYTTLVTGSAFTMVAGQEADLRVSIIGKTIRLYVDGALLATYTFTAAEWTKYGAATAHGFFAYTGAGQEPGGTGGSHWDFLRIERVGPLQA